MATIEELAKVKTEKKKSRVTKVIRKTDCTSAVSEQKLHIITALYCILHTKGLYVKFESGAMDSTYAVFKLYQAS